MSKYRQTECECQYYGPAYLLIALVFAFGLLLVASASAATRLEFPGGFYIDASVNGGYATAILDSHVETHRGRIENPVASGNNVLQVRISRDGSKFAGQGHHDGIAWEWAGQWLNRGLAFGVNATIYDAADSLVVVREAGTETGSQGWRYVDGAGALIPAWVTYADPERQIWEYTTRQLSIGSVTCGQGGPAGLECLINGRRVLVSPGDVRFSHFYAEGDALAFSWSDFAGRKTVALWMTAQELDALPTYTPDNNPPPPPPPPFECGTVPAAGQTVLRALAVKFSSEIKSQDDEQRRAWALRAAQQMAFTVDPGYGSKRADSGRPQTKDGVARVVGGRLCGWDLVNGTTRELQFGHGEDITGQVFIPVEPVDHLGDGPPDPEPSDLLERVEFLERAVRDLEQEADALRHRVQALEGQAGGVPEDRVRALITDAFSRAVVVGQTGSGLFGSHSHSAGSLAITVK